MSSTHLLRGEKLFAYFTQRQCHAAANMRLVPVRRWLLLATAGAPLPSAKAAAAATGAARTASDGRPEFLGALRESSTEPYDSEKYKNPQ